MDSLERFAKIRASIEQGVGREEALRDAGLSPSEWRELQRRWLGALAAEISGGGDTLAGRYWRAYQAALPAEARAASPVAEEPPPVSTVVQAPSFLKAVPARAPAVDLRGTVLAFEAPASPALPFRDDAPAPVAPAAEPKAGPRVSTGTSLALDAPRAPATPFDEGLPPKKALLAATALASEAPSGPATPFQSSEPDALGFSLMRYAELVAARDEVAVNRAAVLARFGIDEAGHAHVEGYWRRKISTSISHAAHFVSLLEDAKKSLATRRDAPKKAASVGSGTVLALDPEAVAGMSAVMRAPSIQEGSSAPRPPELSVEQYAWLVATLRRAAPADVPATLTRLRLTPETRRELEERWAKRMAADAALRESFLAVLARYLAAGAR